MEMTTTTSINNGETKVCVIVDSRTPVIIKVPVTSDKIKLADLKVALPAINQPNYKYFFKSNDSEFGIVKEEILDDDSVLPSYKNRVVAWIVTPNQSGNDLAPLKAGTFRTMSETNASDTYNSTYGYSSRVPGTTTGTTITTYYHDGMSSILTGTDMETTSYFTETDDDSISCSNYSQTTCDTFISQRRNDQYQRYKPNGNSSTAATNGVGRHHHSQSPASPGYEAIRNSPYRSGANNHNSHASGNNKNGFPRHHQSSSSQSNGQHKTLGNLNNISSSSSTTTSSTSSASSVTTSSSSCSDATAVRCITVHLVLTDENFLGLHIYANAVNEVDEGIYVDGVTENSAVAQDGRIEPGDKLIQVNEVNLEELTNDEAVKVLKDAVIKRGPLKLVVAKFIETNNNNNKNDPIAGLKETVQPIDTAAWVAHAHAMTMPVIQQTTSQQTLNHHQHLSQEQRANSTNSSPSFGSANAQDTDCIRSTSAGLHGFGSGLRLNRNSTDIKEIVQHMQLPKFGVELKDREWLKINIPRACLGSDLVSWLERNVCGFSGEREAKRFAARMLKEGHIKDPISKNSFSSKSYYTFATTL